jgi:hypothetical protein
MTYLEQIQRTGVVPKELKNSGFEKDSYEKELKKHRIIESFDEKHPVNDNIRELREMIIHQKNHFDRFKEIAGKRIIALEQELARNNSQLKHALEFINKIKDKAVVEQSRETLFNRKDRAPLDKPVDRNGVAPKDVQIVDIFNCSGKKF